jgi:DNA-directed RNA polymerase subunit RPC12/RpoP
VPARTDGQLPEHPACPHCGSHDTEMMSPFGTVLANAQYRCHACSSPFEFMKWLSDE